VLAHSQSFSFCIFSVIERLVTEWQWWWLFIFFFLIQNSEWFLSLLNIIHDMSLVSSQAKHGCIRLQSREKFVSRELYMCITDSLYSINCRSQSKTIEVTQHSSGQQLIHYRVATTCSSFFFNEMTLLFVKWKGTIQPLAFIYVIVKTALGSKRRQLIALHLVCPETNLSRGCVCVLR
jgi:hypothetical protein